MSIATLKSYQRSHLRLMSLSSEGHQPRRVYPFVSALDPNPYITVFVIHASPSDSIRAFLHVKSRPGNCMYFMYLWSGSSHVKGSRVQVKGRWLNSGDGIWLSRRFIRSRSHGIQWVTLYTPIANFSPRDSVHTFASLLANHNRNATIVWWFTVSRLRPRIACSIVSNSLCAGSVQTVEIA